ncbi:MAG: amino acid adenylation domain-containing protein [bacterium]|nr:amino acid adenylation domain-containing protein [bacterium]
MQCEGIKEAVVLAHTRDGDVSEKFLCAYYIPAEGDFVASGTHDDEGKSSLNNKLRSILSGKLPQYMVPAYFVSIDKIPFTAAGKIDRRILPVPGVRDGDNYIAPREEVERKLVEVWSGLLGKYSDDGTDSLLPIGIDDEFFSLGGDSIKAIQILSRITNAGYKTDIRTLFQYPTIRELAPRLTQADISRDQSPVTGPVPLTPIQQWYFHGSPLYPNHYNQAVMFRSGEKLDVEMIKAVFGKIQQHHDALRMTYTHDRNDSNMEDGATPVTQTNHGLNYPFFVEEFDFSGHRRGDAVPLLEAKAKKIQAGIQLANGPLMRPVLFHLEDGSRLLIVIHHLVIDGISWRILFEDIQHLMQQYKNNKPLKLPLKTDSFKTWSEKLRSYAGSRELLKEKPWWQQSGTQPIPLIEHDVEEGSNLIKEAASVSFRLDSAQTESLLTAVNHAYGTQINDILLTALGLAVRETWGHDRLFIALEGHGREELFEDIDISRTVGWFTTEYPVLLDVSYEDNLERQIKEIKETLRKVPNKGIGYGILKYLTLNVNEREPSFEVKPQFSFNYLGQFDADVQQTGFQVAPESSGAVRNKNEQRDYELAVSGIIDAKRLSINIEYSKKQYKSRTMKTLSSFFESRLLKVIDFCASKAQEEPQLTPSDFTYPHLPIGTVDRLNLLYPRLIEDLYLLTPMQQGMLFHALADDSSEAYFEQFSYRLNGSLDIPIAEKSLNGLFKRHDVLRTAFVYREVEEPVQVVLKERSVDFYYEDIGRMGSSPEKERFIKEFKVKDRQRPFDLSQGVLLRAAIFKVDPTQYEFLWSSHHILMDGWCSGILIDEFLEIYTCFLENEPYRLPPVTPYRTYIKWLEKQKKENSGEYWKALLDSCEESVAVPGMKLNSPQGKAPYDNQIVPLALAPDTLVKLNTLSSLHNVTLNTIIQSVWAVLLGRYNGKEDIVFGSVVSGRPAELEGVETMVGLFINTIPVRIRFEQDVSFRRLIRRVQSEAISGLPHHYYPLAMIQSQSPLKQQLINHILVFESLSPSRQPLGDGNQSQTSLTLSGADSFEQTNYDFNVIIGGGNQLLLKFKFNGNVYDIDFVRQMAQHFHLLVKQVIENEEIEIGKLNLLSDSEKHRLMIEYNDTACEYPRDKSIHGLFEEQVERTPHRIAVMGQADNISITYSQLNERANHLALLLKEKGVIANTIAAIMTERSVEMIIGIFGILKAGGAYLPIDPDFPEERVNFMLKDSNAKIIVSNGLKVNGLDGLMVIKPGDTNEFPNQQTNKPTNQQTNLAYVIYTSGSTGKPKGVMVEHKSLTNYIHFAAGNYIREEAIHFPLYTSIAFDLTITSIFAPLVTGNAVVVYSGANKGNLIERIVDDNKVGVIKLTPSHLYLISKKELADSVTRIRRFVVGGEILNYQIARDIFYNFNGKVDIYNEYGPTEATVGCMLYKFDPLKNKGSSVSIGVPAANARIYLLDKNRKPVPIGAVGEIYIGGDGLARGYLNRPELTMEKFDHDLKSFQDFQDNQDNQDIKKGKKEPSALSAVRLYKTGDLARWLWDGNIEFLGRRDHQVKVRGFRIELGEIESRLQSHPGIKEAVVIDRNDNDRHYLCAYVVPVTRDITPPGKEMPVVDPFNLKEYLKGNLPDYMVPAFFVELETIPLTPSGKVDRKQLPPPLESGSHAGGTYKAPESGLQQTIADVWREILGREKIGITDNFYDLGGNSLDFVKISNKLEEKLGKEIPVATLFTYPTIHSLELWLTGNRGKESFGDITPDDSDMMDEGKDLMRQTLRNLDEED